MRNKLARMHGVRAAAVGVLCVHAWLRVQYVHAQLGVPTGNLCATLGNCNGHGRCNTATKTCECYEGYGASTDVATYRAPDCSLRVCPSGPSWASLPPDGTSGHARAECSDAGLCDRSLGQCQCFPGFEGQACQRTSCLNACSGHGTCMSMSEMAAALNAFPLSAPSQYSGLEASTTWDQDRIFGCVCDSIWPVGLAAGERQQSQWFGPDCSLLRCPSGDDPTTTEDETICAGKIPTGGVTAGAPGNICHVDCSNQGICDYTSGVCTCFTGFYGSNCASLSSIT